MLKNLVDRRLDAWFYENEIYTDMKEIEKTESYILNKNQMDSTIKFLLYFFNYY